MKIFDRISCYFDNCFGLYISTVERCEKKGLIFIKNIYGDPINFYNCRSLWKDKYGNVYKCDELNKKVYGG